MLLIAYSAFDPREREGANEDPLGFFRLASRLADRWLPGITTRTRRIRYYTMICGGLRLIEDEFKDAILGSQNQDEEVIGRFLRWERLWVLWNHFVEDSEPSLIGRNKVAESSKQDAFGTRNVDYPFIQRQAELGALGAYRSSMVALGLLNEDSLDLSLGGRTLGDMFWGPRPGRVWDLTVDTLRTGKIKFSLDSGKLAKLGRQFGLGSRMEPDTRKFLRERLVPAIMRADHRKAGSGAAQRGGGSAGLNADSRQYQAVLRSRLLAYIQRKKWADLDEQAIIERASRGAGAPEGLGACAAAIVALEDFRAATMGLLNVFKAHLRKTGRPQKPSAVPQREAREALGKIRRTHGRFLEKVRSPGFAEVFADCRLKDIRADQNALGWLGDLLRVHKEEMAVRRAPPWFVPAGGSQWMLHAQGAGSAVPEDDAPWYSYRTSNLLNLAKEVGCRV